MRLTLLFFLSIWMATTSALACECGGPHKEEFRRAKAIFIGEAISVGENKLYNPKISDHPLYSVTFKVEKRWKGAKKGEVTVFTEFCRSMCCLIEFREGRKYLVYVYDDSLVPSDCAWSSELGSHVAWKLEDLNSFWFRLSARLWRF